MTKQEQNQIIKNKWVEQLATEKEIPEDIANTYSVWLRGIIKNASAQLVGNKKPAEQEEKQE